MKIHTQTTAGLRELARLIEPMSVAMLTGSDGEGMLASRPMSPLEMDAEGSIWFFTDARSGKAESLSALNLNFTSDATSTYVSIAGSGDVAVNASQTLSASIAGSGDLRYTGDPRVSTRVAGSGSVTRR